MSGAFDVSAVGRMFGYIVLFRYVWTSALQTSLRECPDRGFSREVIGMTADLRTLVEQLKAASHPLRLRALALLESGELCVCQIAETLQVPQSSVSEALRELRRAGFVVERKEGRWVFVSVVPKKQASPLLKGILADAGGLPEVLEDRARAQEVKALSIPVVCSKVQKVTSTVREPTRV